MNEPKDTAPKPAPKAKPETKDERRERELAAIRADQAEQSQVKTQPADRSFYKRTRSKVYGDEPLV